MRREREQYLELYPWLNKFDDHIIDAAIEDIYAYEKSRVPVPVKKIRDKYKK